MEHRSVSRCIAIAAHGKRCQQSPFRGSPYCWHHNRSRKVWAPSRLDGARGRPTETSADHGPPREPATVDLPWLRATAGTALDRMLEGLDNDALAVLVDFLQSPSAGALFLAREGGRIVVGGAPVNDGTSASV